SDGPCPSSYSLTITAFQSMPLVVIVPTIFTVNNDGFNDFYTVYSENAISQKATIYNRWGGVVAELNSPNSSWNGKTNNQEASDGTYYIIYDIKGDNNQEMKGSGYFQKLSKF
ncbi:MAG: gliding motility-associated C-terminal domain-containing protein, partial [Bacteroidota bacterium]